MSKSTSSIDICYVGNITEGCVRRYNSCTDKDDECQPLRRWLDWFSKLMISRPTAVLIQLYSIRTIINELTRLSLSEILTMHAPREAISTIPSLTLTTAKLGCGLNESMPGRGWVVVQDLKYIIWTLLPPAAPRPVRSTMNPRWNTLSAIRLNVIGWGLI